MKTKNDLTTTIKTVTFNGQKVNLEKFARISDGYVVAVLEHNGFKLKKTVTDKGLSVDAKDQKEFERIVKIHYEESTILNSLREKLENLPSFALEMLGYAKIAEK
jgi:hypothetical protein